MKTNIGGDRLGSGSKNEQDLKNFKRSTHNLNATWRSSMAAGTLVPFLSEPALSGDSWDIDLACDVITLPTNGPLFGSFKVQLDVFQIPQRIYNALLHSNRTGIGNNMSSVLLPQIRIQAIFNDQQTSYENNMQVSTSALIRYLGISGIGSRGGALEDGAYYRDFNAIPYLGYWDIYKNYYANKQEEVGYCIHTDNDSVNAEQAILSAVLTDSETATAYFGNCYDQEITLDPSGDRAIILEFGENASQPDPSEIDIIVDQSTVKLDTVMSGNGTWEENLLGGYNFIAYFNFGGTAVDLKIPPQNPSGEDVPQGVRIVSFDLENIDTIRRNILRHDPDTTPFLLAWNSIAPYKHENQYTGANDNYRKFSCRYPQENLALKTYQSDKFNNWIDTEWLDGVNGVNAVTAIDTTGNSFTIDALNLNKKLYLMLNRVAMSGGTFDDWLDAVYEHERPRSMEEPLYHGSLIKELSFEEVISQAATNVDGISQPLGELAGRGRLTNKNKGGKMKIKIHEPSYIMGLVSITPRIEYSQGNKWDINLKTMDDWHKPDLDAIGFQELITEKMAWSDTILTANDTFTQSSAGKQPSWLDYMTNVDRSFGKFASGESESFMVLNRDYTIDNNGKIADLSTYIDPSKYNNIFAENDLEAMNFWVHIGMKMEVRRKMSAKQIPNL